MHVIKYYCCIPVSSFEPDGYRQFEELNRRMGLLLRQCNFVILPRQPGTPDMPGWKSLTIEPVVEEPGKIPSMHGFQMEFQVRGSGKAEPQCRIIQVVPAGLKKRFVAHNPAQHMQQQCPLVITEPRAEKPFHIGSIFAKHTTSRFGGDIFDGLRFPERPVIPVEKVLVRHPGKVSGKPLVQPDIMPGVQCDGITEPLMGQFMRNDLIVKAAHKRHGLVFHSAAPSELGVSVFFIGKRIYPEQITE